MYHLLVDWANEDEFFLEKEFSRQGIELKIHDIPDYSIKDRTKSYRLYNLYFKYIKLCLRAIKGSERNELLICWNFTTSIACGYLCKLLRKQRIILALNILAHPKNKTGEFVRKKIFSLVMNNESYYITVNSELYINEYSLRFNVSKEKFFVLSDPIQLNEIKEFNNNGDYVFVGGEGQRDWETLFDACIELPSIQFVCVARAKFFAHIKQIPSNVKMLYDTDYETFYKYMESSRIVVIPLKSHLPAGLIILLRAALMNKPIIATDTPSVRNYIENNKSGILVEQGNSDELARKISLLFNNSDLQANYTSALLEHVSQNFTQENYANTLVQIIDKIRRLQDENSSNK